MPIKKKNRSQHTTHWRETHAPTLHFRPCGSFVLPDLYQDLKTELMSYSRHQKSNGITSSLSVQT